MALLDVDNWSVQNWQVLIGCERCGTADVTVRVCKAATVYDDPEKNKPLLLCQPCADDYYAYWKEQWDEYYSGRL